MASIIKDPEGRKRILFFAPDGARRCLRIGKCSMGQAVPFKTKIEALTVARMQGSVVDQETARWIADLPAKMHAKLVSFGLVDARATQAVLSLLTVGLLCDQYIADRDDVKPSTHTVYSLTRRNLVDFFGADKPIGTITSYDAEQWRRDLARRGLGEATIRKRCGVAKQFFRTAVKRRAIPEDPFASLKSSAIANDSRLYFVTREDSQKVLDACPDAQWRLIFSLARFGGLRTPSEILALTWSDIQGDRFMVRSSKTERHAGGGVRTVPLFPELVKPLRDVFEQAPAGANYVITLYRKPNKNLRTRFLRIVERAGLKPWPRLFQNLRSTRETELAERFPIQAVTSWLGNSQLVAKKHYLQTTEDHVALAAKIFTGPEATHNAAQSTPENPGSRSQPLGKANHSIRVFPEIAEVCGCQHTLPTVPSGASTFPVSSCNRP